MLGQASRPRGTSSTQAVKQLDMLSEWACFQRSTVGQYEQHENDVKKQ